MDRVFKFIKYVWHDLIYDVYFGAIIFSLLVALCIIIPSWLAYCIGGSYGVSILMMLVVITVIIVIIVNILEELKDYIVDIWRRTK